MSIIRTLTTKISFDVDKKAIEDFKKQIIGFKTRFTLATTAVSGFIFAIQRSLSQFSNTILDTNELARTIGIATKELVGLQRVAGQFRISTQDFNNGFLNLNKQIRLARAGQGDLNRRHLDGLFQIRDANQELLTTEEIYYNIIEALSRVQNIADREQLAEEIFGNRRFAQLANEPTSSLKEMANSFGDLGVELEKANEQALRFDKTFRRFQDTANKFIFRFVAPVLDGVEKILDLFIQLSDFIEDVINKVENLSQSRFVKTLTQGVKEEAEFLDSIVERIFPNFKSEQNQNSQNNSVRIGTINVNMGSDIAVENRAVLEQTIRAGMESVVRKTFEEVGNNFPIIE